MKKKALIEIIALILIVALIGSSSIYAALSDEGKELEKEKEENEQKAEQLQEELEEIEEEKETTLEEVQKLANQIYTYEAKLEELNTKIAKLNTQIEEAEEDIKVQEEAYDERQRVLEARLIATYEAGDVSYLDVLLSSNNVIELISNYYLLEELASSDEDYLEATIKAKEAIELAKKELEDDKEEVTTSKKEVETITAQLESSKAEKTVQVANLTAQEKEMQEKLDQLAADNKKLDAEIAAAEEKYKKELEALKQNESTSTGSGYFMTPTSGGYISATSYYSSGKFHGAIDYAVNVGTPVYAAAAGVVMSTASLSGSYGTYVVIRHANGMQSYYAHGESGSIKVSAGQTVSKGQQIMNSGNTGNSTGPHLHFEVRNPDYSYNSYATAYGQDSRVNPANYM